MKVLTEIRDQFSKNENRERNWETINEYLDLS